MEDTAVVSAPVVEPSVDTAAVSVVVASGEEALLWVKAASAVVVTPAEVAELVVARLDDGLLVTSWLLSAAVVTVGVVS